MKPCHIAGIRFDNLDMPEAVEAIVQLARKSTHPALVCTANLDHMATLERDDEFCRIYQSADLIVADGMPLVWLSRLAGTPLKERVAGSDLFIHLAEASHRTGLRLYFLGGQPGSADSAAEILRARYPNVQIVGCYCPPIGKFGTPDEEAHIIRSIQDAKPDILFVGLGSPKQEKWIARHKSRLGVPVSIGVGASFDMAAGRVRRAPAWARSGGVEWLYRLVQEPRRLGSRYIVRDMPHLAKLALIILRRRGHASTTSPQDAAEEIRTAA